MKNLFLVLIVMLGFLGMGQAQDYQSAVGVRLGYPLSATYKMFLNETAAVEGYVGFRSRFGFTEIRVNAAYQIHNAIESVDGLKWYYGAGPGLALFSYKSGFVNDSGGIGIALSGYIGLEYTLADTPVSFSADWVPTYILGGVSGFGASSGAIAVRYILGR